MNGVLSPREVNAFATALRPGERYPQGVAFVSDRFIPAEEASVPIMDWGFLHSDATYDVAHVWNGSFFRLEDHLDRFYHGMAKLHMSLPHSRDELRTILTRCVQFTGLREAYVEMICTRGIPASGSRDPRSAINRFYAFAVPFIWLADPAKQRVGLHMAISTSIQRIPPSSVDPRVKNYHWLDLVAGLFDAYGRGAETTLLTDTDGNVVEGAGFNVFVISQGTIASPSSGVLEGITRKTVLEIAEAMGCPVELRQVPANEVRDADEVFVTSTAGGVVPVTRVDDKAVANGTPGAMTLAIRDKYWELHCSPVHATQVIYD